MQIYIGVFIARHDPPPRIRFNHSSPQAMKACQENETLSR